MARAGSAGGPKRSGGPARATGEEAATGSRLAGLRRRLRWPLGEGDWGSLTSPVPLAGGQVAPAGKWVRIVGVEDRGERLVVEIPGFGGAPAGPEIGVVARVAVSRDRLRPIFFPRGWRPRGE